MVEAGTPLLGHERAWETWRSSVAGARMHHGWILAGREGLGKASFALQAARDLVAEPGVKQPGTHPDIIVLTHLPASSDDEKKRDEGKPYQVKRSIGVDQVRAMQRRLTTRPTLGARRAIIIDPADDLERNAGNALLKSLEEPPVGTTFLLVAHRPGRLLPTIRSRCRMLVFPTLGAEAMQRLLAERAPDIDAGSRLAAITAAGGSPGAALEFLDLGLGHLHTLMTRIASEGDEAFALRSSLADAMGQRPDRRRQAAALDLARAVVRRRLAGIDIASIPAITKAHAELTRLAVEAPTYNFDPGLLTMQIGSLLATLGTIREAADG